MPGVDEIWGNALLREQHARQRMTILAHAPDLAACSHNHYLSLHQYASGCPQRFYSVDVFEGYLRFLEERDGSTSGILRTYLEENRGRLDGALFFLDEVNRYAWHDEFQHVDDYELLRFIDQEVHPAYLRVLEAVFGPLIHLVAFFSRVQRGKDTEGLDLFTAVEEVKRTELSALERVYRHVVRNGIAHGGVTYLQGEIRYEDKKGNQEVVSTSEIVRAFDDLVDVCNGMALGLKVFLLVHLDDGYAIPQGLLLQELQAETASPWWLVEGCVPCWLGDRSQLLIYARPRSTDYLNVQFHSFLTAVLAEQFAPGYDRYFVSLRSPHALPGWAGFDGRRIRAVREQGPRSMADYVGILEDNLVFYVPKRRVPRLVGKIDSFIQSAKMHMPLAQADMRARLGLSEVTVRSAKIHASGVWAVLDGSVVLESPSGEVDKDVVRRACSMIIRRTASRARGNRSVLDLARVLPLGYARVAVFRRDYRKRRLVSFGLARDLVCTIDLSPVLVPLTV